MQHTDGRLPAGVGILRRSDVRPKVSALLATPRHLLTGLIYSGDCGAPFLAGGKDHLCCSAARRLGTCKNRKGIRRPFLEGLIVDALKWNLMRPDLAAEFIKEFHAEIKRLRHGAELSLDLRRRQLLRSTYPSPPDTRTIVTGSRSRGALDSSACSL